MDLEQQREAERRKYAEVAYPDPRYRMGDMRRIAAHENVESVGYRTSYLDVSTGRGEMLGFAEHLGFERVQGTEVVPGLLNGRVIYADAWALPFADGEFDLVTCFDVIEHILPEDEKRTLKELNRVSGRDVFLTANNRPSRSMGVELHVNRLPYDVWDEHIRAAFDGEVTWLPADGNISQTWHIRK